VTYALAIFSVLKDVPEKTVTQHLKRSLIPFYKRAVKEVAANEKVIQELKEIQSKNSVWTRV